jgi:polyhydroxybutyrate depolymerase
MRRLLMIVLAILLLTAYGTAHAQTGTEFHTMTHDGHERSYYVYTPEIEATRLLILLHPVASSGLAMQAETNFNAIADAEGYVVVYPNAVNTVWDDGRLGAGLAPEGEPIDDVGFLATLAGTVAAEHGIDSSEVYLAGVNNGATMAMTAACETPELYAGIGVVSALIWDYQMTNCGDEVAAIPVNMIFIYGSRDPVFFADGHPINDIDGNTLWTIQGAADTADFWLNRNGCDPAAYENFTETALTIFDVCNNGTRLAWFTVLGGGGTWLRPDSEVHGYLGVDTSAILNAFFTGAENLPEIAIQAEASAEPVEPRSWLLYVPSTYDASKPTPMVVHLHGRFANAFSQAIASDFNTLAEREGIIVLYPNALNSDEDESQTEWNYGRDIPTYQPVPQNDEAFINALINDVDSSLNIDRNRLYVTGLSNGGLMTQRLACTEEQTFAAFATVAASAPHGLTTLCDDSGHAPVLFYIGTEDSMWTGATSQTATGTEFYIVAPMDAAAAFWASHNECSQSFQSADLPNTDPDSSVRLMVFENCPNDAAVVIFAVLGGGHVWHGVREFETSLGENNMDYNASEVIWQFFSQYTLEGRVDAEGNLLDDTPITLSDVAPVDAELLESVPTQVPPPTPTAIANAEESQEAFVINQLQQGGYVIFINHAATDPSQEDTSLDSCETQRNLSEFGRTEAEAIGRAFEVLEIPVGVVYSSAYCRAQDTATIAFGQPEVINTFFELGVLVELISQKPEVGTNNIIVGHADTLLQYANLEVGEGDSIIFLPLENGNYQPLTLLPSEMWVNLAAYYVQNLQGE